MACPYFLPVEELRESEWERPPRAPLGRLCSGVCEAGAEVVAADHELCNFGYARGRCARFPEGAEVDAVRFAVGEAGRVMYVLERGHLPVEWGVVESLGEGRGPERVRAQARVFAGV